MFCFNKTQLITSGVPFPSFVPLPLPSYPRHNLARASAPRRQGRREETLQRLYCSTPSAVPPPPPYVTLSPSTSRLYPATARGNDDPCGYVERGADEVHRRSPKVRRIVPGDRTDALASAPPASAPPSAPPASAPP